GLGGRIPAMSRYVGSNEFRGAEFIDVDMSAALFREVDLSGARMYGVLLTGADIDGDLRGLRLNGVEVAPLVEAELDRLHPERTKLRATTPAGMREAWEVLTAMWAQTLERVAAMHEADLHRSVNEEWSFTQTLRHLVFVTDLWLGHAVLGEPRPFHPLGLPASFITVDETSGIDVDAAPTFLEVIRARDDRVNQVRTFLAEVTQEELDRVREPNPAPNGPAPAARTAASCLRVIFNDEWAHHQFAVRDLALIEAERRQ
ncbi:MAG TPA: DinB family protein, partial [Micromonosporaceae bacterium]